MTTGPEAALDVAAVAGATGMAAVLAGTAICILLAIAITVLLGLRAAWRTVTRGEEDW